VYLWASSQHLPDAYRGKLERGIGQHFKNDVINTTPLFKALLDQMDSWATDGTPPPHSRTPSKSSGTLVTTEEWRSQFPDIPGAVVPQEPNPLPLYDYGADADRGYISNDPPLDSAAGDEYAILVAAVDKDGNECVGIQMPLVQVPVGTYCGWNIRAKGFGPGAMASYTGSYIPFPETRAERKATGDRRLSIQERYDSEEAFLRAITQAAKELAADGFLLLEEDLEGVLTDARNAWKLSVTTF
jgi:hypothetical protein